MPCSISLRGSFTKRIYVLIFLSLTLAKHTMSSFGTPPKRKRLTKFDNTAPDGRVKQHLAIEDLLLSKDLLIEKEAALWRSSGGRTAVEMLAGSSEARPLPLLPPCCRSRLDRQQPSSRTRRKRRRCTHQLHGPLRVNRGSSTYQLNLEISLHSCTLITQDNLVGIFSE